MVAAFAGGECQSQNYPGRPLDFAVCGARFPRRSGEATATRAKSSCQHFRGSPQTLGEFRPQRYVRYNERPKILDQTEIELFQMVQN